MTVQQVFKRIKNARFTFCISASCGNIRGNSCLNISTHDGTAATISQPSSISRDQLRDIDPAEFVDALEVALLQLGHAATLSFSVSRRGCRCARIPRPGPGHFRFVLIAITGGEQGDSARGWACCNGLHRLACGVSQTFSQCVGSGIPAAWHAGGGPAFFRRTLRSTVAVRLAEFTV